MAWENGFFNSVNGDRLYNAETMNKIFDGLITNGVYESVGNKLAVQPNSGMTIQINTGRGFFNRHWVNNSSIYLTTVDASDVTLNRWCGIFIRVDENDSVRTAEPVLVYSQFASNPVKPVPTRLGKINEYCLAYVYIRAGATQITASDIVDTRADTNLCGWVTGLIEQLSSTTLFEQFTDIFNNWLGGLQDLLDQNTAAMLVNALPVSSTITLSAANWVSDGDVYTQSVQIIGMNNSKSVVVQPVNYGAYYKSNIKATVQDNNALTFSADTLPTIDINVNVLHMGR